MRELQVSAITEAVAQLAKQANCYLPQDVYEAFHKARANEPSPSGQEILGQLLENADIARNEDMPICQDTGLAIVFVDVGQDVHLTGGALASSPDNAQRMSQYYRQLARASRSFAFVADLTVALLGGGLKTKQKITGRLADALSELYMLAAVLKRYDDDGRPQGDHNIVELAARNGLYRFQEAMAGVIDNFPVAGARPLMRAVVFPLGRRFKPASDALGRPSPAMCSNRVKHAIA